MALTIADLESVVAEARAKLRKANAELDSLYAMATRGELICVLAHEDACRFKERQVQGLEADLAAARQQLADEISY